MSQEETPHGADPAPFELGVSCDGRIGQFHDYWQSLHLRAGTAGALPGRQHLDPLDIPHLLPWLRLIDVAGDPVRLRYRLIGTAETAIYGDHTGRWIDEVFPNYPGSAVQRDYLAVVTHCRPVYYRGVPRLVRPHDVDTVERLTVPLARDGRRVDMLLSLVIHRMKMPARR